MDDPTDIFASTPDDLDVDLANAGVLLQKLAAEQGVDLNALSDVDVADLLTDLMPGEPAATAPETQKESAMADTTTTAPQIPNELTYADVAAELAKVAAAEGIDMSGVSREEYHEAFDALATRMTTPEFAAEKTAEAETAEKLAEADLIGRQMAASFIAAIKTAEEEPAEEKTEKAEKAEKDEEKKAGFRSMAYAARAKDLAGKAKAHVLKHKRTIGEVAGGSAAAGAGYGAGRVHEKHKKSFDESVVERAREILAESGINPDTGDKIAEVDVDAAAVELLKQNGYTFEG